MPVFSLSATRQRYHCPLEPVLLVQRLQEMVNPWNTGDWFRQHCFVGTVDVETQTFIAQTSRIRSPQLFIRGRWRVIIDDAATSYTAVDLFFHIPRAGLVPLLFLGLLAFGATIVALLSTYFLAAGIIVLFSLFATAIPWLSLRSTQDYFEQALLLNKLS